MTRDSGRADGVEHSEFEDAMAGFRERARISNGARAEVIAEALQAILDGTLTEETRLTARAAAHSLAGSAGTFGFPHASRLGRDLEALLDTVDADPHAQARTGLEQVALLRQALTDSADTGGGEASRG
jgi:HPt (histidine-containing phosphotransfer) domain-containing protein